MNLTEPTIKFLAITICGDNGLSPRKKGPELMTFFADFDQDNLCKGDFSNRLRFAESKLKFHNDTPEIAQIIEKILNFKTFSSSEISRGNSAKIINTYLKNDGLLLSKINNQYKVSQTRGFFIESQKKPNRNFIVKQFDNCLVQVDNGQINSAIERAQDLLIMVMSGLIESYSGHKPTSEKNIDALFKEVKKAFQLDTIDPKKSPIGIIQILSGFESIIEGLSRLKDNITAHSTETEAKKCWAKLMINSSNTMAEFLIDFNEELL